MFSGMLCLPFLSGIEKFPWGLALCSRSLLSADALCSLLYELDFCSLLFALSSHLFALSCLLSALCSLLSALY
jgi:hypothetical protein